MFPTMQSKWLLGWMESSRTGRFSQISYVQLLSYKSHFLTAFYFLLRDSKNSYSVGLFIINYQVSRCLLHKRNHNGHQEESLVVRMLRIAINKLHQTKLSNFQKKFNYFLLWLLLYFESKHSFCQAL